MAAGQRQPEAAGIWGEALELWSFPLLPAQLQAPSGVPAPRGCCGARGGSGGGGTAEGGGGKIPKSVRDPRFNPHSQGRILSKIGVFAPPAPPAPLGEGESALAERKEPSGSSRRRSRPLFQPPSRIKFPFPAFLCPFSVPFLPSPACPSSYSLPFVPSSPSFSLKKPKKGGKLPTMEAEAAEYFPVPLIIPGLSLGVNKCGEKSISGHPRISLCLSLPAKILRGEKNPKNPIYPKSSHGKPARDRNHPLETPS